MFWSIFWSLVILSSLNGFIRWNLPSELQLPNFIFSITGGFPSLYGYQRQLGNNADEWRKWLEVLAKNSGDHFAQVDLTVSHRKEPICSLTTSTNVKCNTFAIVDCSNSEDQRCAASWFEENRQVQCARTDGTAIDCQTNGYNVHSVHSYDTYRLLILKAVPSQSTLVTTTNHIAKSSDCNNYLTKADRTTIVSIPIPGIKLSNTKQMQNVLEINSKSKDKEILLRTKTLTTIFYEIDVFNQNSTLLSTYLDAYLNTTQFCDCNQCVNIEMNIDSSNASSLNDTNYGIVGQWLNVDNRTLINITSKWNQSSSDESNNIGSLEFSMQLQIVDTKTPLFWRRPGRFDCPSEVTCPLELLYLFYNQQDLQHSEYVIEVVLCIAIIGYLLSRKSIR
ncbi:hypothetical protein M3Y95_00008000 [Aphelenchoides besseyi]|nr:hypothetical protein M3Y95_00008000 [Aphelenchoides besseyi]